MSMEECTRLPDRTVFSGGAYYIETFGCQMNVRDSETVAGLLETMGLSRAENKETASLILYNTCCVRDHAEKRVFGNIGALKEWKEARPGRILGVFGCMMQQEELARRLYRRFPYVDVVFGTNLLSRLPSFIDQAAEGKRVFAIEENRVVIEDDLPSARTGGVNAFVNINYGCDNFCTYCIVPYVRGRERSREPESIIKEATELVARGYSEITLLGQNVNSYGHDLATVDFSGLLCRVSAIEGLRRIRFMTSHPKDLDERLIETIAALPNVCRHVHLPLQSGSNRVLEQMNRRYTREGYLAIVERLRAAMDDVELTTDIIVGFPGETEEAFADTLDLVERVGFASAFTFRYSPRTGTRAASMPGQIPDEVKRERLKRLNVLQERKSYENNASYVGKRGIVHVEACDTRHAPECCGKFSNFKMVYFPGKPELVGSYLPVRVKSIRKNSLIGVMEEEEID